MTSERRFLRKIRIALLVSFLIPLLGCSTPEPLIVKETEKQRVPQALLTPCPASVLNEKTYQGAVELALALRADLAECNRRLEDIRRWSE